MVVWHFASLQQYIMEPWLIQACALVHTGLGSGLIFSSESWLGISVIRLGVSHRCITSFSLLQSENDKGVCRFYLCHAKQEMKSNSLEIFFFFFFLRYHTIASSFVRAERGDTVLEECLYCEDYGCYYIKRNNFCWQRCHNRCCCFIPKRTSSIFLMTVIMCLLFKKIASVKKTKTSSTYHNFLVAWNSFRVLVEYLGRCQRIKKALSSAGVT